MIELIRLDKSGVAWAQVVVTNWHYLHSPVDARCTVEGYRVEIDTKNFGFLLLGRPEATRCKDWYGSVDDMASGRCEVTRWQVLNLARVWLSELVQPGGDYFTPEILPGFMDRRGQFRSTLASTVLRMAIERVGFDYLLARPPCFLDEPYEIRWLLSYCDTRLHKGTIYKAAGFELYRTNDDGIQTWRIRLPGLTPEQDQSVRAASLASPRSQAYRAQRAQLAFELCRADN